MRRNEAKPNHVLTRVLQGQGKGRGHGGWGSREAGTGTRAEDYYGLYRGRGWMARNVREARGTKGRGRWRSRLRSCIEGEGEGKTCRKLG